MRRDIKTSFPPGMEEYLEFNGWHFSKKMCNWAVSMMYREEDGKKVPITPISMEELESLFTQYGYSLHKGKGYDSVYLANMCKADFLNSSVRGEPEMVLYVKDVMEDPDGYEGMVFTRFYADCIGSGTPICWEDLL